MSTKMSQEKSDDAKLSVGRSETGRFPTNLNEPNALENGRRFLNSIPGLELNPSEEQKLQQLRRKKERGISGISLDDLVIATFNVYSLDPTQLREKAALKGEKMFFFVQMSKKGFAGETFPNDDTFPAGRGHWKVVGGAEDVLNPEGSFIIGVKTVLVYFVGDRITNWVIHEYALPEDFYFPVESNRRTDVVSVNQHDYWVLCEVYQRKERSAGSRKASC